jgi:hypothetical protein
VIRLQVGVVHGSRIDFQVQVGEKCYDLYFNAPGLNARAEALVPLALLAAMSRGDRLKVEDATSATFLAGMLQMSSIFAEWFPEQGYRQVVIEGAGPEYVPQCRPEKRVAAFFTGGVDSFYTFLKHRDEITDLIYVHGFDLPLNETEKRSAISAMGQRIEQSMGVRFIEVETNSRKLLRDFGRWGVHGHGLGLGCVGRLLADQYSKIYIPSSFHERDLFPWSSHPRTDVLYSDESIEFVHDGCEAYRAEKLEFIAGFDVALENLRVCGEKQVVDLNCGRCEKCVRTMTSLYACGVLDKADTFAMPLTEALVRKQIIYDESITAFVRENIALLQRNGKANDPIESAWKAVLNRSSIENRVRRRWFKLRRKLGLLG